MQACIQQRAAAGARPFTAARPAVFRPVAMPAVPRHAATPSARPAQESAVVVRAAAVEDASPAPLSSENVMLRIRMRSYEKGLLADAVEQIRLVSGATGAVFSGPVMLPTKRKVYTVLRSPHVNKDAREQFEIRTHNRLVDVKNLSAETVSAMMNWVPPPGVEVECSLA